MFKKGDKVVIVKEWRDIPDEDTVYEVLEWNGDRGFIAPVQWKEMGFSIRPTSLVDGEMIDIANS